jgi:hypothetical protein
MINVNHPARGIPSLAETVSRIDDQFETTRTTPAIAASVALNASYQGYQAGRHDAIRELLTATQVADELGVTKAAVIRLAQRRGVGWQLDRGYWLFRPDDVAAMRERLPAGRPKAAR